MVGAAGFELATPCTPCKCATRLRYAPTSAELYTRTFSGRGAHEQRADRLDLRAQFVHIERCRRFALRCRRHRSTIGRFEAIARAADGEALLVEQFANAPDQKHFVMLVV